MSYSVNLKQALKYRIEMEARSRQKRFEWLRLGVQRREWEGH